MSFKKLCDLNNSKMMVLFINQKLYAHFQPVQENYKIKAVITKISQYDNKFVKIK